MAGYGSRRELPGYLREWQEKIEGHARRVGLEPCALLFPQPDSEAARIARLARSRLCSSALNVFVVDSMPSGVSGLRPSRTP